MMSASKGLLLFGISICIGACFNPPDFPITPSIDFESVSFEEAKSAGERDALVLTITFRDGDGDLGLSASEIEPPYHDVSHYLANDGQLAPLEKRTEYSGVPQILVVPPNARGKLAIVRTSRNPSYHNSLPAYTDAHASCTDYTYTTVYVKEADKHIFDKTYHYDSIIYPNTPKIYRVTDTLYYQKNPSYSNIDVEFWVKDGNDFKLFDWEKEFCTISFNQRFHVLSDEEAPLQGKLEYSMVTSGMKNIFGSQTLKLKVRIRDRRLNNSNQIETPEFILD